ncbi:MAG TPA: hypothetical protein VIA45_01235 [Thermoanaerobaculia bacterium]|jgi:hypothetical protein
MKVLLAVALLVLATPSRGDARTVHQIELRGNGRVLAKDAPVRRGRVYLFHRYPDGVYMSVAADDVRGIAVTTVDEKPKPVETVLLGPTGEGQTVLPSEANAPPAPPADDDDSYFLGYYGGCSGCYGPVRPSPRPPAPPPALVGSNGFPLMPGSPPPLPIGPNGFPIIAPQPPVVSPR